MYCWKSRQVVSNETVMRASPSISNTVSSSNPAIWLVLTHDRPVNRTNSATVALSCGLGAQTLGPPVGNTFGLSALVDQLGLQTKQQVDPIGAVTCIVLHAFPFLKYR